MKTSGGKYGGEKVAAGGKLNAEAKSDPSPAVAAVRPPAAASVRPSAAAVQPPAVATAPPPPASARASAAKPPAPPAPTPTAPAPAPSPNGSSVVKNALAAFSTAKSEAKSEAKSNGSESASTVLSADQKAKLFAVKKRAVAAVAAAATPQELPIENIEPSPQQMNHLKHVFKELDKEQSGYLTDLVGASKKAGFPVDEETASKLLKGWSGRFNFDEFVSAVVPVLRLEHRNWIWVKQLPSLTEEEKGPSIPGRWKTVRVFLSSTFVDMHGERDCLINEVFPEINNRVKSHYVRVVPVDLRWGVSSEETNSIQSTCLNEIDHCRTKSNCLPWFVGLRGRRLGWVQTKYQPPTDFESPDKLKWIPPFWQSLTPQSITSMEVYHAFVGATPPADDIVRSIFVFRENEFEKDCPESMKWLFDFEYLPKDKDGALNQEVRHQYAYVDEYAQYLKDYEQLQKEIRDTPHPKAIFNYPCNFKEAKITGQLPWGKKFGVGSVGKLDAFRDFIIKTLTDSIQAEFPFPGELTPQERESAKHAALIEDRAEGFVGRAEFLQAMLDYCQGRVSHNGAMVIVGEPGSGKSALMARFCEMYRSLLGKSKTILISHLIGASEDSELVDKLLRRICEIIVDNAKDESFPDIPDDFESLKKDTWSKFVGRAVDAGFRVVIVLDAVNQLRPLHNAHSMTWLPSELPEGCKIVISTLEFENNTYANLKHLHLSLTEQRVTPLDSADRQALVSALLAKYHKKLTCDSKDTFLGNQMEILLNKEQGTSPLYLVVACDVLRRFGVYEKLTEYLKSLPGTIPKLFEFVLADLESQHGQELVRIVASLLAVSRGGLSEIEILAILSAPEVREALGETKSNFSQLYGPLRSFFSSGGEGYIRFFHDQLLYVVRARYQLQPDTQASGQIHRFLGHYFREVVLADLAGRTQATVGHAYGEVAYHLLHAGLSTDLKNLFLTVDFNYRRIELFSIFALLDDYELYLSKKIDGSIKMLRAALQLATPILSQGPGDLMFQLYLRLSEDLDSYPELAKLLDIQSEAWKSSKAQHSSGLLPVYDSGIICPGTVLSRMQGSSSKIEAAIPLDSGKLLTSQVDGQVTIWDLVSGKPLVAFEAHGRLTASKISPDRNSLLTLGKTTSEPGVRMKIWNLQKPQPTGIPLGTREKLQSQKGFAINNAWNQVVTWHEDSAVVFWDLDKPDAKPHIARHPKFYDNWQRMKAAEAVIEKRSADRKVAREKKQAARGGEAHSSDESQGDEDDGIAVDYDYSCADCKIFSKIAVTFSDGDDGTVCIWNNQSDGPIATFDGVDSGSGQQGGCVIGEEAKNGPCMLTWSLDGVQTWNFNNLKGDPKGEYLKIESVNKVVASDNPNQLIALTDDVVKVIEFTLPAAGKDDKITLKVLSEIAIKEEKGVSNSIVDGAVLGNSEIAILTSGGQVLLHRVGDANNVKTTQLTWGADVNMELERKKEKESKNEYSPTQAAGCSWTGECLLVRWANGMLTPWIPATGKCNYLFVDTNEPEGVALLPAAGGSALTRAVLWYSSGLTSYIDLTHEGVKANKGDQAAKFCNDANPLTYVRKMDPMKNTVHRDDVHAAAHRAVAFDCMTGESRVFHLNGGYGATTLDAGPTSNMQAGLTDDNTYVSSHTTGVCLWDLAKLNPHIDETVKPGKVHRLLKHRTKKDPGELKISPRTVLNLGSKLTTAYQIPAGTSKLLKSEEDMFGAMAVGDTQALQWGEHNIYLWNIPEETCVPLKGHTRSINDVYVSEDLKYALSTSEDCSVRVWNLATQTSNVLLGVHSGTPKAKFLPGTNVLQVVTWGKREACLWTLENNAVTSKQTFTPTNYDEDEEVSDVIILQKGLILALRSSSGFCTFFDVTQPFSPKVSYVAIRDLYPMTSDLKLDGAERVVGCAARGSMTIFTVQLVAEGAPEVRTQTLRVHNSLAKVKAVSKNSLAFFSYGAADKKVVYWSGEGEKLWDITFGYPVSSLHFECNEDSDRLRSLFVHMEGGNFALLKPHSDILSDYAAAREALVANKAEADKQKDASDELDALLASLENFEVPGDKELDDLLASLNDITPAPEPEMDPELAALLKSLE